MGLGKSFETIATCDLLGLRQILIVCPGIVRANWLEEFDKWATVPRSKMSVTSSKDIINTDVVIVSYSLLRSLPVLKALLMRQWDVLVLDEAHSAKNPEAWRTRALYGMKCDAKNGVASKAKRVWLLSGTLMPNNPSELWSHCHALFPSVSQGMGVSKWINEYCRVDPDTGKIVGAKNTEKLITLMKPNILRRLAKDVLPQLPPLRFAHIPLSPDKLPPMSSEVKETAAVVQAAIAAMQTAATAADGRKRLAQIDQGAMASLRKWTGIAKAPAVVDYIKQDFESGMDRIVVFAYHREPIAVLEAGLPEAMAIHGGISPKKRDEIIKEFRFGDSIKSLICQVEIANAGIQLVSSANAAFAETLWVPKDLEQAAARLHRQGQLRPVLARLFSLQGSFDETVNRVLQRKTTLTKSFNNSMTSH